MSDLSVPVVIGPSGRRRRAILIGVGVVATLVWPLVILIAGGQALSGVWYGPFVFLGVAYSTGLLTLRTVVTTDEVGVQVRGAPSRRGRWAWDELLELGWFRQGGYWTFAVRPQGSTWDSPGPTAPHVVYPPLGRRDDADAVGEALAAACARHGVPFTRTAAAIGTAPPGSPLRDDGVPPGHA